MEENFEKDYRRERFQQRQREHTKAHLTKEDQPHRHKVPYKRNKIDYEDYLLEDDEWEENY